MGASLLMLINSVVFLSLCSASLSVDRITHFDSFTDGKTLLSSKGIFEFGFFSPGNTKNRYVGIWYVKIPIQTVVWVANRCRPINDLSGLLKFNRTSNNLVLLYQNKTALWSTNSSGRAKKPILQLLDTGNLVLRDEENGGTLWQSFDHPSDTLLPEMKLGWDFKTGVKRSLSSWRSWDDPCPGNLTYGFELNSGASPEIYLSKGKSKHYRSGPWNGLRFSGVTELIDNPLYDFLYIRNDREIYYMYKIKIDVPIFPRVVLNETMGTRVRDVWIEPNQTWTSFSSAPNENCDVYNFCGPNGVCSMIKNTSASACNCIRGFKPRIQEELSSGCVREKTLDCGATRNDSFVRLAEMKIPDTAYSWLDQSLNLNQCRIECLHNCSCMAYTNSDIRRQGSGCIMWFGDLMDLRSFPSNGQGLFVRVSASVIEAEKKRKAEIDKKRKAEIDKKRKAVIIGVVIGGVFGLLLFSICICKKTFFKDQSNQKGNEDIELPLFDLATISSATNNFATENKLGEGGFGPVYRGTLKDGQEIAVKRLSKSSGQGINEFKNEVILITKLQHRNLVRLLGCCIHGDENLLIYEYMPNKSLDFFIFDEKRKMILDWSKRFEIVCGIARGILYLHQDSRLRIIHRDLKVSNVLLDSEMIPKISDFGMAKTFGGNQTEGNTNRVVGTYGYMAPEYASDGQFSVKSDVFSFGILILEIISGKKNRGFFNPDQNLNLTGQAWRLWKDERCIEFVDECLAGSCTLSQVFRCVQISLLCVQNSPEDRPNMSSVVVMLGSQSSLAEPKEPGFFMERDLHNIIDLSSSIHHESQSNNDVTISQIQPR